MAQRLSGAPIERRVKVSFINGSWRKPASKCTRSCAASVRSRIAPRRGGTSPLLPSWTSSQPCVPWASSSPVSWLPYSACVLWTCDGPPFAGESLSMQKLRPGRADCLLRIARLCGCALVRKCVLFQLTFEGVRVDRRQYRGTIARRSLASAAARISLFGASIRVRVPRGLVHFHSYPGRHAPTSSPVLRSTLSRLQANNHSFRRGSVNFSIAGLDSNIYPGLQTARQYQYQATIVRSLPYLATAGQAGRIGQALRAKDTRGRHASRCS